MEDYINQGEIYYGEFRGRNIFWFADEDDGIIGDLKEAKKFAQDLLDVIAKVESKKI